MDYHINLTICLISYKLCIEKHKCSFRTFCKYTANDLNHFLNNSVYIQNIIYIFDSIKLRFSLSDEEAGDYILNFYLNKKYLDYEMIASNTYNYFYTSIS